jgi:hypothetical protein
MEMLLKSVAIAPNLGMDNLKVNGSIAKIVTHSEVNRAGGMLSSGSVKVPNLAIVKMAKK